jgi:integrase
VSVYKPSPGSRWWIDTTLPEPFGRVRLDSWADKPQDARDREALLRKLYRMGQHETLRAILTKGEGQLLMPEVVAADRENRLQQDGLLADVRMRGNLWVALARAFEDAKRGTQRHRYHASANKLEKVGADLRLEYLGKKARVSDLARVDWQELLDVWPDSDADYMHVRRMVSRFLTVTLKALHHPTRLAIMASIPSVSVAPRLSELSLERFEAIIDRVRYNLRAAYWTMLITALRTGEYLRCEAEHRREDLHVINVPIPARRRTKAGQSRFRQVAVHPDLWRIVEEGIPAPLAYKHLREQWKRACRAAGFPDVRLHDIRHLSAHLGFLGGASATGVQTLLRHMDLSSTMKYAALEQSREGASRLASVLPISIKHRKGA